MKGVQLCILATWFLLSSILLGAQDSAQEADKARVLSLENAWNEAETHNDAKALDGLLAATFVYTDADGNLQTKAEFLAAIRAGDYHPGQIVNESMKAEPYPNVMIVTGTYREQGRENGKAYLRRGRFTDTWIKQGGQWLCVASQETLIAAARP